MIREYLFKFAKDLFLSFKYCINSKSTLFLLLSEDVDKPCPDPDDENIRYLSSSYDTSEEFNLSQYSYCSTVLIHRFWIHFLTDSSKWSGIHLNLNIEWKKIVKIAWFTSNDRLKHELNLFSNLEIIASIQF